MSTKVSPGWKFDHESHTEIIIRVLCEKAEWAESVDLIGNPTKEEFLISKQQVVMVT
jgi:hypothetical protein